MYLITDREGNLEQADSLQDRFLAVLYRHMAGRAALRLLIAPGVSKAAGWLLDTTFSRILIAPFIRSHAVAMEQFERRRYRSFNDFFTRKLQTGARQVTMDADALASPCDSRLSVWRIDSQRTFCIKQTQYTVESLLRSKKLARAYANGYIWIFRLCVDDYHRYTYSDSGKISDTVRIPGVFHTVNPAANDRYAIYKENTREYCLLKSKRLGTILQMEVGAMLVGRIVNHPRPQSGTVQRGDEKGYFAYGGSTIILLTQAGAVQPDADILRNSQKGIETKVKLGEHIGRKAMV